MSYKKQQHGVKCEDAAERVGALQAHRDAVSLRPESGYLRLATTSSLATVWAVAEQRRQQQQRRR